MNAYRAKRVAVEAIRWMGGDWGPLDDFCGRNWSRADVVGAEAQVDDDEQVVVWNTDSQQWMGVPVGHWILRGVNGELYPCSDNAFAKTHEMVGGDDV